MIRLSINILLSLLLSAFHNDFAQAEYSEWKKIKTLERYGRSLKRKQLVPVSMECRRRKLTTEWRNVEFRVKIVSEDKLKIRGWKMVARKYTGRGKRKGKRHPFISWSHVAPGKSGIGTLCLLSHY